MNLTVPRLLVLLVLAWMPAPETLIRALRIARLLESVTLIVTTPFLRLTRRPVALTFIWLRVVRARVAQAPTFRPSSSAATRQ
jgi:hypothetical protein